MVKHWKAQVGYLAHIFTRGAFEIGESGDGRGVGKKLIYSAGEPKCQYIRPTKHPTTIAIRTI